MRTSFILFLVTLTRVSTVTSGLKCRPISECNQAACVQPVNCLGGRVKDVCGCCEECARQKYQTCGGPFEAKCDRGLECVVQSLSSSPDAYGTCLESQPIGAENLEDICTAVVCEGPLSCPEDSLVVAAERKCCPGNNSSGLVCKCDVTACLTHHSPLCDWTSEKRVMVRTGTGKPGDCCPSVQCYPLESNCSSVVCPESTVVCPPDSFSLPSRLEEGECCSKAQGCQCLPIECKPVLCPEGQRVKVLSEGTGKPGSCCTTFRCISEMSDQTCTYDGVEYSDGASWTAKCKSCTCKGNVSLCNPIECNNTAHSCGHMKVRPGECCPVCIGCISDGTLYSNGDVWREGDCKVCTCVNGQAECQSEFCASPCENPKPVAGQCCPQCDETSLVTLSSDCPSLHNCTLLCANGMARDSKGCFTCHCQLDGCDLTCEHGYAVDASNRSVCKCNCPPLLDCDKKCLHGLKSDGAGCPVCRCFSCRSLKCARKCPYGYVRNARGCRTCHCMSEPTTEIQTSTESSSLPPAKHRKCDVHEEGETWHDGCRSCYCYAGKELCTLINCPFCKQPVFTPGDCCPKCSEGEIMPKIMNTVGCPSADGGYHIEGDMWMWDSCTQCICHEGQMFCERHQCPPVPCSNAIYHQNKCCPECPDVKKTISLNTNRNCSTEDGKIYEDGAHWWDGDCLSCKCSYGKVACFPVRCPKVNCDNPVLKKGQCCAFCVDTKPTPCLQDDILHDSGKTWSLNECTQCLCLNGHPICKERVCNQRCNGTKLPGQCCPICMETEAPKLAPEITSSPTNSFDTGNTTSNGVDLTPNNESCWSIGAITLVTFGSAFILVVALILCYFCLKKFGKEDWIKNRCFGKVRHYPLNKKSKTKYSAGMEQKNNARNSNDLNDKSAQQYEVSDKLLNV